MNTLKSGHVNGIHISKVNGIAVILYVSFVNVILLPIMDSLNHFKTKIKWSDTKIYKKADRCVQNRVVLNKEEYPFEKGWRCILSLSELWKQDILSKNWTICIQISPFLPSVTS